MARYAGVDVAAAGVVPQCPHLGTTCSSVETDLDGRWPDELAPPVFQDVLTERLGRLAQWTLRSDDEEE